jgi:hypothetical protein
VYGTHWGAALAESTTDLSRDFDYIFFYILDWRRVYALRDAFHFHFFFIIIWFPSHVYDLFVVVLSLTTATVDD